MNGLNGLRRLFGLHPMNEAAAAEAPAATASPAAEAPAAPAPVASLLGNEPAAEAPEAAPAAADGEQAAKADEAKAEDPKAADGAPEAYAEFTAPEGLELNPAIMPELGEVFRELNLPQDKAQGVLNKLLAIQAKAEGTPEQQIEAQNSQIAEINAQLAEQSRNLPELGGENFNRTMEIAGKVMAKFGTTEFRELINYTAVGSHPEFVKFIHAIGSAMSDDVFENGGAAPGGQKTPAERLWPSSN